jgi:hypothetical protein
MIAKGLLTVGDKIFVYSKPVEQAMVGIIEDINYPLATIKIFPRDKNKFKEIEQIDLSKNLYITILDDRILDQILSEKEKKKMKEVLTRSENNADMFEGTY